MTRYGSGCEDCVRCPECGEVAYCLAEPNCIPPCPTRGYCEICRLEACEDCQEDAEALVGSEPPC